MSQHTPNDWDYMPGTIRVRSGKYVDVLNLSAESVDPKDIAHGLAHLCRFGGHTAQYYSVAEHSLHVAAMLMRQFGDEDLALAGLLHDAAEAYLGDIVRPLKHTDTMNKYRDVEEIAETAIESRFSLQVPITDERIKAADSELLVWEMAIFRDTEWRVPTPPPVVAEAFLTEFDKLQKRPLRSGLS